MSKPEELKEYLMSDVSLIHISTHEYARGIFLSKKISKEVGFSCVLLWKYGIGVSAVEGDCTEIKEASMQSLLSFVSRQTTKTSIIIQDIHRIYENKKELSLLQETIEVINSGTSPVNIIGISTSLVIPDELQRYAYVINFPLPSRKEIKGVIIGQLREYGITLGNSIVNRLAEAFNGLIGDEIRIVMNRIIVSTHSKSKFIDESSIAIVLAQKKQIIQKTGLLEFVEPDVGIDDVGGLHNLKSWLKERKTIFDDTARAAKSGLKPPKGILLFGMPGSGKSLTAKITANYYSLPLLRVDMGIIYGQKSPEEAISKVITIADTISPCILWIDELEKALAGSESGSGNEVGIRILGILLTWMQERTAPVFIIATANDISMIRPETYRDGRIDEKFFLGFLETDIEQIGQIITIHLKKRLKHNYETIVTPLDYQAISKKMSQMVATFGGRDNAGYTGANMEALVEKVLMDHFCRETAQINTRDFIRILNSIKPQHGKPIKIMLKHAEEMEAIHA